MEQKKIKRIELEDIAKILDPIEQYIIINRYSYTKTSFFELSLQLNLPYETVKKIEKNAYQKLKTYFKININKNNMYFKPFILSDYGIYLSKNGKLKLVQTKLQRKNEIINCFKTKSLNKEDNPNSILITNDGFVKEENGKLKLIQTKKQRENEIKRLYKKLK